MNITLYRMDCEKNKVDKTKNIYEVSTVSGTLRTHCSITDPVILVELSPAKLRQFVYGGRVVDDNSEIVIDDSGNYVNWYYYSKILTTNYARIPDFDRYYYITDVTCVRNNLFQISLHVDVLMSFRREILALSPHISRYQGSTNYTLPDNLPAMPANATYTVNQGVGNTVFSTIGNVRYILTSLSSIIYSGSKPVLRKTFNGNVKYVVSGDNLDDAISAMNSPDFVTGMSNLFANNPIEGVVSVRMYPFSFDQIWDLGEADTIYLGSYDTGVQGYLCSLSTDTAECEFWQPYIYAAAPFGRDAWSYYMDDVQVFLPFHGFVSIPAEQYYGRYIQIKYVVNFDTGTSDIFMYSAVGSSHYNIEDALIWQGSATIGVDIPMSQSNSLENVRNSLISGLTGILSIAAAPASGGLSLAGLGGSIASQLGYLVPHMSRGGSTGGAWGPFWGYLKPFALVGHKAPQYPENFASLYGYPYQGSALLRSLTGFVRVEDVHLKGFHRALTPELEEIEQSLKSGVVL